MEHHESKNIQVKAWIRERIIFLALAIFVFGAAAYIGAEKLFHTDSMWFHPLREFSLLISMIGVVSLGYELFLRELTFNEYKDALQEIVNPDAVRLGIRGIYKNRAELGRAQSFEGLFKKVRHEVFIGGTSLLSISTASRELLKEKILQGVNVKLLLMDPHSRVVDMITQQGSGKPTFINEIKTSLLLFQKLQEEIDEETDSPKKGKLMIHTYQQIPSHSFIAVDEDEPGGIIIADIGPYLGRSNPRPSMVIANKKDGLFDYWRDMNKAMWAGSKPFFSHEPGPAPKTKTLVIASSQETEYYDKETGEWKPSVICQTPNSWRGIKGAQWIWIKESPTLEEAKTGRKNRFRIRFHLPPGAERTIIRADLFIRAEDVCRVTVNDVGLKHEYDGAEYPDPFIVNIDQFLKSEDNSVEFELIGFAQPNAVSPNENPIGLIFRLDLEYRK